jgi:hypothetical protein
MHEYDPSIQEAEAEDGVHGQPGLKQNKKKENKSF